MLSSGMDALLVPEKTRGTKKDFGQGCILGKGKGLVSSCSKMLQ